MAAEIGSVLAGKVTSIMPFGAFVSMEGGTSGLVHISEISNTYISDINQFLSTGMDVRVKILAIDPKGKLSLSIKQADGNENLGANNANQDSAPAFKKKSQKPKEPLDPFEEMMKKFKQTSEEKVHDLKRRDRP